MANDYDKVFKENFEPLLPQLLEILFGLKIPKMVDLKDKLQVTMEREMDNLKRVVHDDPSLDYGIHWEFQTNDEDMRARNFLYYALFYYNHKIPLKQIVIFLGDNGGKNILNNTLEIEGLKLNFLVVDLKSIPKDVFLQSQTPEGVIMAILADFGEDKPETVIRQILQHLLKLIGRVDRLKKYQRQLQVLSRLRKLEVPVLNEIKLMPIYYDIETDGLYLQGIEVGIEKGAAQGFEKEMRFVVIQMLNAKKYSLDEISHISGATKAFIMDIANELNIKL